MGRIRTIKPEFHAHEELSALPPETHLLAAALVNYADDEGYFNANPILVKAGTNSLRNDPTPLEEQLRQLEAIEYIKIFRQGLKCYGIICNFLAHQRVSHATPSKLKGKFDELSNSSRKTPEEFGNDSDAGRDSIRPEGNGRELNGTGNGTEGAPATPARPASDPPPPKNHDMTAMVERIVMAHPRSLTRKQRWGEAGYSQKTAVLKAMQDEIEASGCSGAQALEMILARVELQAREVPEGRYQFFKDIERYFALHEYRLDPEHFNREDRNASNQGNRAGGVQGLGNRKADEASSALALAQARIIAQYADAEADCGAGEDVPEPRGGDGRGAAGIVLEGAR